MKKRSSSSLSNKKSTCFEFTFSSFLFFCLLPSRIVRLVCISLRVCASGRHLVMQKKKHFQNEFCHKKQLTTTEKSKERKIANVIRFFVCTEQTKKEQKTIILFCLFFSLLSSFRFFLFCFDNYISLRCHYVKQVLLFCFVFS